MTINDLAKIVENLAIEMREGFIQVNKRLDNHEEILKQHSQILEEHSNIFKRNNLK